MHYSIKEMLHDTELELLLWRTGIQEFENEDIFALITYTII